MWRSVVDVAEILGGVEVGAIDGEEVAVNEDSEVGGNGEAF